MAGNNPWAEAYKRAVDQQRQAVDQLVGQETGTVDEDQQFRQYQYMKNNPRDLIQWSTRMNGPERAAQEAQRYLKTMQRKYGQ